jgi:hypothetical protein
LKQHEAVYDVYYEANLSQKVSKNLSNFLWYGIGLSILFIFVAFFIVRQSVILQMQYAKSLIINEEEDWRMPSHNDFLIRNFKNSLWSAALSVSGLIIANYWFGIYLGEIASFLQNKEIVIFLSGLTFITIVTYISATYFTAK